MDHQVKVDAVYLDIALVGSEISGDNLLICEVVGIYTRDVLRAAVDYNAGIITAIVIVCEKSL